MDHDGDVGAGFGAGDAPSGPASTGRASPPGPWTHAPGLHLTELIRNVAGIGAEQMDVLLGIVEAHERSRVDVIRGSAAWDLPTIRDEEETEVDPDASVAGAAGDTSDAEASEAASMPLLPVDPPPSGRFPAARESLAGRYELIRFHAKGGIGQVWSARDRQLQREVALKRLKPGLADRPDLRARFLVEAEITGKLEHPGIVPVYSLGEDEEGRPYYAMRFVHGDSLAVAIRGFHAARRKAEKGGAAPADAWGLEFRQLLGRFLGACETLEYAHSKNCIHRDLKPSNIMVAPFGGTVVVDWGLAKIMGGGPEPTPHPDDDAEPIPLATPTSGTSPGDLLGTPHYSSPEQAVGQLDRIGPRSDVYSLGATLFELLTGEVPFEGKDHHVVIAAVLAGPKPPRSVLASIPPALESICLRAMRFKPEERYRSAAALARDLENWLADEPVGAHPEGRRERAARWIRRHRTWAYAAAAALVVVSLAATASAIAINRAWRGERAARAETDAAFRLAQGAVDEYLTKVSQNTLLSREDSLDMRRLREELLGTALRYYQQFVETREGDPALRRMLARAYHNVGVIKAVVATPQDAIGPLEAAVDHWEELLTAAPADRGLAAERARTLLRLGKVHQERDRPGEALEAMARAADALEALVARPGSPAVRSLELVDCLSDIAAIHARGGAADEALAASARARAILAGLLASDPQEPTYREALAEVVNNEGFAASKKADYPAALAAFRECLDVCLGLLKDVPPGAARPIRAVELAGTSGHNIGDMLSTLGKDAEAAAPYREALVHREALGRAHPTVRRYRLQRGLTLRELAKVQHRTGDPDAALRTLESARECFEDLVEADPDGGAYRHQLGWTLNNIGCILDVRGDHRGAAETFRRAADEHRRASEAAADVLEYRFHLAVALANLSEQHADLGEAAPALSGSEEAARIALGILRPDGTRPAFFGVCVGLATTCGELKLQAGDVDGALACFDDLAGAVRDGSATTSPSARDEAADAARARRAACLIASGKLDEAAASLRDDAERLRARAGAGPASRGALAEVLWLLARSGRAQGLAAEADAALAERRALWRAGDAATLVERASRAARRVCLLGEGRTPPAHPVGARAREADAEMAADDVRLALDLGYADRARLRDDLALMTALDRPSTRRLRDDLAFPDSPFAPAP